MTFITDKFHLKKKITFTSREFYLSPWHIRKIVRPTIMVTMAHGGNLIRMAPQEKQIWLIQWQLN